MASDHRDQRNTSPGAVSAPKAKAGLGTGAAPAQGAAPGTSPAPGVTAAAHRRSPRTDSPRPRVELHINELTGTMSWRTLQPQRQPRQYDGARPGRRTPEGDSRAPAPAGRPQPSRREQAAALRSAGLDPSRVAAHGAAPISVHPATVRTAVSVSVESLGPEQLQHHLARVGALRSRVTADLAHGTGMPSTVAARLRSGGTAARAHALTAEHASAARESGHRGPATRIVAAARPSTPATPPGPTPGPRH